MFGASNVDIISNTPATWSACAHLSRRKSLKNQVTFHFFWNDFQCQKLIISFHERFKNVMWYVNDFHLEMTFLEIISIWKWFFLNDLLPQKMISGCFLRKKMIYRCEKSFPSSSEMIFYTRKWFRSNSKMIFLKWFLGHFLPVLKMWFTLEKKNISFGNGHFRKWMEIIFFQKMLYNLPIFSQKSWTFFLKTFVLSIVNIWFSLFSPYFRKFQFGPQFQNFNFL